MELQGSGEVKYMSLFSITDRKNVMDYIISFTEHNEHIVVLVVVGSVSYGFNDELSDLDFVKLLTVMKTWKWLWSMSDHSLISA